MKSETKIKWKKYSALAKFAAQACHICIAHTVNANDSQSRRHQSGVFVL